jgi:hypothetical protein
MTTSAAWLAAALRAGALAPRRRIVGDRGEGVVSAAIAVLIMAFLGALMWFAFQAMFVRAQNRTECQVDQIGSTAAAPCP